MSNKTNSAWYYGVSVAAALAFTGVLLAQETYDQEETFGQEVLAQVTVPGQTNPMPNPVPPLLNPVPPLTNPVPPLSNPIPPLVNPLPPLLNPVPLLLNPVSSVPEQVP